MSITGFYTEDEPNFDKLVKNIHQSFQKSAKLKAEITHELHYKNETSKLKVDIIFILYNFILGR